MRQKEKAIENNKNYQHQLINSEIRRILEAKSKEAEQ
jgi:hypothetical protein